MNSKKFPKISKITDFKIGNKVQGFFLCTHKDYKISKNGSPFLDIKLSDNTGKIEGKVWENADHFNEKFTIGNPVALKGVPVEFLNHLQLNISQISNAELEIYQKYGFNPDSLVPSIKGNPEKYFDQILNILNKLTNKELKLLSLKIFEKYKAELISSPASLKDHYPIKGGLILHLYNCMNLAIQCCKNYKNLNKDLMICGSILHDIGKINCYSGEYIFSETDESKLLGHDILGLNIVNSEINSIKNFPNDLKQKLNHILIMHHKSKKDENRLWQRFPEAIAIFNINRLDAQIDIMSRVIDNAVDIENGCTNGRHHFKTSLIIE